MLVKYKIIKCPSFHCKYAIPNFINKLQYSSSQVHVTMIPMTNLQPGNVKFSFPNLSMTSRLMTNLARAGSRVLPISINRNVSR